MKMKTKWFIPLFTILAVLVLLSCAPAVTPTTPPGPTTPTEPAVWEWPSTLTVSTPALGSSSYLCTMAWAPVMEQATGMKVRVVPEDNQAISQRWLALGTIDMTTTGCIDYAEIVSGGGAYKTRDSGPVEYCVAWQNNLVYSVFYVSGNSDIKTVYDLKPGVRVADWPANPIMKKTTLAMLALAGLTEKDVVFVPFGDYPSQMRSVAEGKADVAGGISTAGIMYEVAAIPGGLTFLDLTPKDEAATERMQAAFPVGRYGTVKMGYPDSIGKCGQFNPFLYYVRDDMDPEFVYHFAKWLDENNDAYKEAFAVASTLNLEGMKELLDAKFYFPWHEGTIRYLKEKGVWTAENEALQKWNLEIRAEYIEAYKAAIAEADETGIKIDPANEKWVELWESYTKDLTPMGTLPP